MISKAPTIKSDGGDAAAADKASLERREVADRRKTEERLREMARRQMGASYTKASDRSPS